MMEEWRGVVGLRKQRGEKEWWVTIWVVEEGGGGYGFEQKRGRREEKRFPARISPESMVEARFWWGGTGF
ncbi:uncharacterized protein G2W53_045045 [Senna tora]|uniref:Uncharacterized protein n=1 Tax=Senna tora TaxID=362788 RepID=A0A834VWU3_9FABA|nr:uncharacterized protein G2W53_045045 [Senna tora]